MSGFARMAEDVVAACQSGDADAEARLSARAGFPVAGERLRSEIQRGLGLAPEAAIGLVEARTFLARLYGFEAWQDLPEDVEILRQPVMLGTEPLRDWDAVCRLLAEGRATSLAAHGQMTDAVLARIAEFGQLESLRLSDCKGITDAGLRHLARLGRLRHLELNGCRITDAGVAHLARCEELERVELMWTATGDGAIRTLAGLPKLRHLKTGIGVTDAGLAMLHEIPAFKRWPGGEATMSLLGFEAGPTYLLARGPFTDRGVASLRGLDGLFALNLAASELAITAACLPALAELPKLGWLAFDATDESMPAIAALPHLRFLMCQDTPAGDEGFTALSRSPTLEYLWGRRCHNLQARGFAAMAEMPALRALSVSCKNVDNSGLSALLRFPALRELMPMDVPDEGYRHVGRCENLESLVLMYCRETTDAATAHLTGLTRLKSYFASYNGITDRSLEMLGRMLSLEKVELVSCTEVTDAGLPSLAALPRLREVRLAALPRVTRAGTRVFPASVQVGYSVS